jgi:hypothetical protein
LLVDFSEMLPVGLRIECDPLAGLSRSVVKMRKVAGLAWCSDVGHVQEQAVEFAGNAARSLAGS